MTKLRIVKEFKPWSPFAGIKVADMVEVEGGQDACARFVSKINASSKIDYTIIDYEVALITTMDAPEVIENPTGGGTGKLILPVGKS